MRQTTKKQSLKAVFKNYINSIWPPFWKKKHSVCEKSVRKTFLERAPHARAQMQGHMLGTLTSISHSSFRSVEGPQVILIFNYIPNAKSLDLVPNLNDEPILARLKNSNSFTATTTQTLTEFNVYNDSSPWR